MLIVKIVRSVLPEFSTIEPVSVEAEEVIFSPAWKVPDTLVKLTLVVEVPSSKTNPVAPDVAPII